MVEGRAAILADRNVWIDAFAPMLPGHDDARRFLIAAQLANQMLLYPAHCMVEVFDELVDRFERSIRDSKHWAGQESEEACRSMAWDCLKDMDAVATAVGLDGSDVRMALRLQGLNVDLEDIFVLAAAERAHADYLVTSNSRLIQKSTVAALTPQDMRVVLEAGI